MSIKLSELARNIKEDSNIDQIHNDPKFKQIYSNISPTINTEKDIIKKLRDMFEILDSEKIDIKHIIEGIEKNDMKYAMGNFASISYSSKEISYTIMVLQKILLEINS